MNRTPERIWPSEEDPRKVEMQKFCEDLQDVIDLVKRFKDNPSEELKREAETAAVSLYHQSFQAHLPYPIRVTAAEGINAHSSQNYTPIEEGLSSFVATDVRSIDTNEVVFMDFPNGDWYVVFGHDMQIEPVFPDESSGGVPENGS